MICGKLTDISTQRVGRHRARRRSAGFWLLSTTLPEKVIMQIDWLKEKRGAQSRAPIIEEAVRLLIETQQRA